MKPVIIFGAGYFAQMSREFLAEKYEVVGFVTTEKDDHLDWRIIGTTHPPEKYDMFIAVGYSKNNKIRERFIIEAKSMGYFLVSYIHPSTVVGRRFSHGENCIILEGNVIQPDASIGMGVTIWSSNVISHHNIINNFSFITDGCILAGHVTLEKNCFLGIGTLIRNRITLPENSFIKMGSRLV